MAIDAAPCGRPPTRRDLSGRLIVVSAGVPCSCSGSGFEDGPDRRLDRCRQYDIVLYILYVRTRFAR